MMTNTKFSKVSLAISAIVASGGAAAAAERNAHDAADHARPVSTAALDLGAIAAGRSPAVPGAPSGAAWTVTRPAGGPETRAHTSRKGGPISRAEVISRAKYWFDTRHSFTYSMTAYHRDPDSASDLYRKDCSGLVSMALHLTTSLGTVTLPSVGVKIARTDMQPGDFTGILGRGTAGPAGHVRLFERWADRRAGTYWAYDFGGTLVAHQIYTLGKDAPRGGIGWTAYRYKNITNGQGL